MEIEQIEILEFLNQTHPIDRINNFEVVKKIARNIEIIYKRKGDKLFSIGETNKTLYLIRTGAIELFKPDGGFYSHFGVQDWLGHSSLLSENKKFSYDAVVSEDCLLYCISEEIFLDLYNKYTSIQDYFDQDKRLRLKNANHSLSSKTDNELIFSEVGNLLNGDFLISDENWTIVDVAKKMKAKNLNATVITKNNIICGIVTDRAFCDKVVVEQISSSEPISKIMTPNPITIDSSSMGSEALLIMAKHNIRHLPVIKSEKIIGIISLTDLIRKQAHNALYLIKEINSAQSINKLIALSSQTPQTLSRLVRNGHKSSDIVAMMSSITDSIAIKILNFAEEKFGKPPVDYLFLVAGSQGRDEQASNSDQDNVMLLSDEYDEKKHGEYFFNLAKFVNDALNECGFIYCPGDIMAMVDKWRQPYQVWLNYFKNWINSPEPKALMYASTFFDMRPLYGKFNLFYKLQKEVNKLVKGNQIFLSHMSANALSFKPPIGIFQHFILSGKGKQKDTFNMKKTGLTPIVDLARIYALSEGITEVNTVKRILEAEKKFNSQSIYSKEGVRNLLDAYNFLSTLRLKHQANQIDHFEQIDNNIHPKKLSQLERGYLKDAFEVVSVMQSSIENRFGTSQFR